MPVSDPIICFAKCKASKQARVRVIFQRVNFTFKFPAAVYIVYPHVNFT